MASLSPLYIRLNPDITPLQDTYNILIIWDIVSRPIKRFASSAVAKLGLYRPYGVEFGFKRLDFVQVIRYLEPSGFTQVVWVQPVFEAAVEASVYRGLRYKTRGSYVGHCGRNLPDTRLGRFLRLSTILGIPGPSSITLI